MGLKEEELQKAKEVALKVESELKEITLKHTAVNNEICNNATFLLLTFFTFISYLCGSNTCMSLFTGYLIYKLNQVNKNKLQ